MLTIFVKTCVLTLLGVFLSYLFRSYLKAESFISDSGGLSIFVSAFGTLYGIMTAFIVFEVWSQFNKVSHLVGNEALGLERLYRLTLNLGDQKFTDKMQAVINDYANLIIQSKFKKLGEGERNKETSHRFRLIFRVIRSYKATSQHQQDMYNKIIEHYGDLSENRNERVNQSLIRLPGLLRIFLYTSSFFAVLIVIAIPFQNIFYNLMTAGVITFLISIIFLLVEDLDNPFKGYLRITPEPFLRALNHIEKDYA